MGGVALCGCGSGRGGGTLAFAGGPHLGLRLGTGATRRTRIASALPRAWRYAEACERFYSTLESKASRLALAASGDPNNDRK